MAEAVAADGARVVLLRLLGKFRLLDLDYECRVLVFVLDFLLLELLRRRGVAVAVPVCLVVALARGDELGEHPGERVDLVAAGRRAGGCARLRLCVHAVRPEEEGVTGPPLRRGGVSSRVPLGACLVQRAAA